MCNIVFLAQPHRQKRWSAFRRSAFVVSIRQIAVTSRSIKQRKIFIKTIPGCSRRHHIDIHAQIIVSCAVTNGGWEPSTPADDRPDSVFVLAASTFGSKRASYFDIVVGRRSYNTRAHRVPPEGGHVPVCWQVPLHPELTHTSPILSAAETDLNMSTRNVNCCLCLINIELFRQVIQYQKLSGKLKARNWFFKSTNLLSKMLH